MKIRFALSAILITALSTIMLSQVSMTQAAVSSNLNLVTPITSAVYFLSGSVSLRLVKTTEPLVGAIITAYNSATNETYTTSTNTLGNYSYNLHDGTYAVSVSNTSANLKITPASKSVTISGADVTNVNFTAHPIK